MAADYYDAETESGDHVADPSEDALLMLFEDLDQEDNNFVTITAADGSDWYAVVSLLDDGRYEVELRDPVCREHELTTVPDPSEAAHDLITWLADRPRRR